MSELKRPFALGSRLLCQAEPTSVGDPSQEIDFPDPSDGKHGRNQRTVVCEAVDISDATPVTWRAAFDRLHPLLLEATSDEPAVLAAVIGPQADIVGQVLLEPNQTTVVGRHTHCRLRLADPRLSLRHLVVHVERTASGTLCTRVLDLQTDLPFCTEDGETTSAVVADGPLFITLGPYLLAFVPIEPRWPDSLQQAWSTMPARSFSNEANAAVAVAAPSRAQQPESGQRRTKITHIPRPSVLLGRSLPPDLVFARITLATGRDATVHELTLEDLKRGVLIGRYARCFAGAECEGPVSRVHLLLVAIGDFVWAIDTASTNGSRVRDDVFQCMRLGRQERLYLAQKAVISWSLEGHALA